MSAVTIDAPALAAALMVACDRIDQARDELGRLDAVAGDGDLGVTMSTGFGHVRLLLEGPPLEDIGALLKAVGLELARKAPSTMGTLLGTAFLRAGAELAGRTTIDTRDLAAILERMASSIAERGKVAIGQRTVLDAMDAGARAAATACEAGGTPKELIRAAADAARVAADATADMEPQVGRAGWIPDRARGVPDAGAVAWAVILDALATGL